MNTVEKLAKELFDNIGRHRTALMGLSMILVFLHHARSEKLGFMTTGLWTYIFKNFKLSVDTFFFLSAFGLCFSLKKNTVKKFYWNRFKRIIPTWWVVFEENGYNRFLITCIGLFICVFALSFFWKIPDVIQAMPLLPIVGDAIIRYIREPNQILMVGNFLQEMGSE